MTDLELTRLCAEAMGWIVSHRHPRLSECQERRNANGTSTIYNPLHDDAQAMALVKKFDLSVWGHSWVAGEWPYHAEYAPDGDGASSVLGHGKTHNYAICECVAKMKAAK